MGDKLKIVRKNGFSALPNAVAQDPRLNLATKGLFWLMFSLPQDWDFSVRGLAVFAGGAHGTGRAAITAALKTLEETGYMLREQRHDEKGKFTGNTYVLYDESTSPLADFPSTEKPSTENLPQTKEYLTNIPPIVPQGGRRSPGRTQEPRAAPEWKPERFAGLWEYYPHDKRGNKQRAIAAWDKLHASDKLIDEIAYCLRMLKLSAMWRDGYGIPHVSTFLNPATERWKDAYNMEGGAPDAERDEVLGVWH